jgi:hypothetical protein
LKPGAPANVYIVRIEGEAAWDSPYSEDWYATATIGGQPAVIRRPPAWAGTEDGIEIVVREDFGLSMLAANLPVDELIKIAENLNR